MSKKLTFLQPGRQGDVLLVPVKRHPEATGTPLRDPDGSTVLARGEVTGHRHRFAPGSATELRATTTADFTLLDVGPDGGQLVHEEHSTVPVPAGRYEVRIQREYDPPVHGSRRVED